MSLVSPLLRSRALLAALWVGAAYVLRLNDLRANGAAGRAPLSPWLAALPSALFAVAFLWTALRVARWARHRGGLLSTVGLHAAAALGLAAASTAVIRLVDSGFGIVSRLEPESQVLTRTIGYALLAGVVHALEYARRLRRKELDELRLRAELSEAELSRTRAELRVLKLELNPHFLFNALHTVSSLMHEDVRRANGVLVSIGELLRRALDRVGEQEVALEEELEFLRAYLQIEQVRLGERLQVEWEIDEEALDAAVPHLLLQPLVENALKHGIAPQGGGRVRVGAACEGERLRVWVEDDGAGLQEVQGPRRHRGVGVGNVKSRLEQLYGAEGVFTLRPGSGGGARAEVLLPLHAPPPPAAALPSPRILEEVHG